MNRSELAQLRTELRPIVQTVIESSYAFFLEKEDTRIEPLLSVTKVRDRIDGLVAVPTLWRLATSVHQYRQTKHALTFLADVKELQTKYRYVDGRRSLCFMPSSQWFDQHSKAVRETSREVLARLAGELDNLSFD